MNFGNPNPQPLNIGLQAQQLSNNEQGVPLVSFAGTRRVAVKWMSPVYNIEAYPLQGTKKGGSKKNGTNNNPNMYNYYGTVVGGVGIGPADGICGVVINGEDAWPNAGDGWQVGNTFSAGDMAIYDAQVWVAQANQNGTVASTANAPGEVDGSNNPYWTQFVFEPGDVGDAPAWASGAVYKAGAEVTYGGYIWECLNGNTAASGTTGNAPPNTTYWTYDGPADDFLTHANWVIGTVYAVNALVNYNGRCYKCATANTAALPTSGNEPGSGGDWDQLGLSSTYFDDLTITPPNQNTSGKKNTSDIPTTWGTLRIYWGLPGQTQDPNLASGANNFGHNHPPYTGMVYIILLNFWLGQGNNTAPNVELIIQRNAKQSLITGSPATLKDGQVNVIAWAAECVQDENMMGLTGVTDSSGSGNSWNATAALLDANAGEYAASPLLDAAQNFTSILSSIIDLTDGWFRWNPATSLIECGLYQHGVTPAYTTINQNDLTKRPQFKMEGWTESKSRAIIRFNDRVLNYAQNSDKFDDPRAFFVLGAVRSVSLDRPWVTRNAQAVQLAAESLRVVGKPKFTGEIEVRREIGRPIRPGDYILLDVDLEPNTSGVLQFFRVKQRKIPATGPITFTIEADNTLFTVTSILPQSPYLKQNFATEQLAAFRIIEAPLGLAAEADSLIVLGQRSTSLLSGFYVYFDTSSTGTFSNLLGAVNGFGSLASLQANVAATDTTLSVTVPAQVDQDGFTSSPGSLSAANNDLLAILVSYQTSGANAGQITVDGNGFQTVEICSVSEQALVSGTQYTLTVNRGAFETNSYAFTTGNTEVWLIPKSAITAMTHGGISQARSLAEEIYLRLTPWDSNGTLPLADATSEPFEFCNPLIEATVSVTLGAPGAEGPTTIRTSPTNPPAFNFGIATNDLTGTVNVFTYGGIPVTSVQLNLVGYTDSDGHTLADALADASTTKNPTMQTAWGPSNTFITPFGQIGASFGFDIPSFQPDSGSGHTTMFTFAVSVILANAGGVSTDYYFTVKFTY